MIYLCGCTSATVIRVHCGSGSATMVANPKPSITLGFNERTRGAEYQDLAYGKGMRVHNLLRRKPNEQLRGRCSVCATIKTLV
jgi:hypothetical protein